MRHRMVAFLAVVAAMVAGCTSKPTLAGGEWKSDVLGGQADLKFGNDGAVDWGLTMPILGTLPAHGTFSETDKTVSITLQRIDLPDSEIGKQAERLVKEMVGRAIVFNLVWLSRDEVELTPQTPMGPLGQKMTLRRKIK